jgi:cytochrome c-type biogenesis protein CcmH/NrfG
MVLIAGIIAFTQRARLWEWRLRRASLSALSALAVSRPQDARVFYHLGARLAENERFPEAAGAFQRAFQLNEKNLDSATQLGAMLLKMRRYPESFQVLRMVVGRDARQTEAHSLLGMLYLERESYGRAAEEFQTYLQLQPRDAEAWHALGKCYAETQRLSKAENALKKASALNPQESDYLVTLARTLLRTGKFDEAERSARQAVKLDAQSAGAWFALGATLARQTPLARYGKEAERALRRSLELAPGFPLAHAELGALLMAQSRYAESAAHWRAVVREWPNDPDAHFQLAKIYRRWGEAERAEREMQIFHRLSEYERRLNELQTRIEGEPNNAALRFELGRLYAEHGQFHDAVISFRDGLTLQPNNAEAQKELRALERRAQPRRSMGQWVNGSMSQWVNGSMGQWVNGSMGQ